MQTILIREVMVPIKEYATVSENDTMAEAVLALEKAQEQFDQSRYKHRAILVYNDQKKIVGKISQMDLLKGLEPGYGKMMDVNVLSRTGFSLDYLESMSRAGFWKSPLSDICRKAATRQVKNFMYTPGEGEYIDENADLGEGVRRLVAGHHHSLLVTRGQDIVGILRLTDVFKLVSENIKTCKL